MSRSFREFLFPSDTNGRVCPFCGEVVPDENDFCQRCGHPMRDTSTEDDTVPEWDCGACNTRHITSKFCPNCGHAAPPQPKPWTCECGNRNITTEHCPHCGAERPIEHEPWECHVCGRKKIAKNEKFCPQCGAIKGATKTWTCPHCGKEGLDSDFCPYCGHKKPDAAEADPGWTCSCGHENTTEFCSGCGKSKPWTCTNCGEENITSRCCPECGSHKPEPEPEDESED